MKYEYEQYPRINRALPRIGEEAGTPNGLATVIVGHRLKATMRVQYEDDHVLEWPLAQVNRSVQELDQDLTESGRPILQQSYPRADQGT